MNSSASLVDDTRAVPAALPGDAGLPGDAVLPEDAVLPGDDWAVRAACRAGDPDTLFVQGAAQNRAKQLCGACPVKLECLADALDNQVEFGVWGGLTERERRALLKRRPDVSSWRRLLEAARRDHETRREAPEAQPHALASRPRVLAHAG